MMSRSVEARKAEMYKMRTEMLTACIDGRVDMIDRLVKKNHIVGLKDKNMESLFFHIEEHIKHIKAILASKEEISLWEILNIFNLQKDLTKYFEEGINANPTNVDKLWLEGWCASRDIRCIIQTYFADEYVN